MDNWSQLAEQSTLGACLIGKDETSALAFEICQPGDFGHQTHRMIAQAIVDQMQQGGVDAVTVAHRVKAQPNAPTDLFPFIANLAEKTPTAANVARYAEQVRNDRIKRELVAVGQTISADASRSKDIAETVQAARAAVLQATSEGVNEGLKPLPVAQVLDLIERRGKGESPGIKTGFKDLDARLIGLAPGTVTVLAARPSMGKSAVATNVAYNAAQSGTSVAFFSLEMSDVENTSRFLSRGAQIPLRDIITGQVRNHQKLSDAAVRLTELPITIDEQPALTVEQIHARLLAQSYKAPIGLIIIDYLQLMSATKGRDIREQVTHNSQAIKRMAKTLQAPVVLLSQLNRSVEQRGKDARPIMSDLRESGAIEQDADNIIFLHRQFVNDQDTPHRDLVEVITAKCRNGEPGTDYLREELHMMSLYDWTGPKPTFQKISNGVGFPE